MNEGGKGELTVSGVHGSAARDELGIGDVILHVDGMCIFIGGWYMCVYIGRWYMYMYIYTYIG